ncbi:MAG: outer-membrane lipoprotein carrier protein [Lysobacteraceae bacterium]|nr:MAG: outer-membrane lipoprotein carrier protein [Xanthomonadaceae bacterium]
MSRVGWLMLLAVVLAPALRAADARMALEDLLDHPEILRGRFEQEKQISGFRNVLRSEGRFLVVRGRGILWQTDKPFPASWRIVAGRSSEQTVPGLGEWLEALLQMDITRLEREFDIELSVDQGQWAARLSPQSATLVERIRRIELRGDRRVRAVAFEDGLGNKTKVRLIHLESADPSLTEAEAASLD